jgi:hypothetical protein
MAARPYQNKVVVVVVGWVGGGRPQWFHVREENFQLALTKIVPWFFALDHIHYSRWIPVHKGEFYSEEDKACILCYCH